MSKPIIISIAGGTASGKTTVVNKIVKHFNSENVSVISMDNYYKRRDDLSFEERKKINYDHPDAIDMDLLKRDVKLLLEGNKIYTPVYDFSLHNRDDNKQELIKPTKVIIIEGILALYDESIRSMSDIHIFVESDADIRFIRRLKRDIAFRGRTLEDVIFQYLTTVKPMFDSYVAPTKRFADIIIPNDTKNDMAIEIIIAKIKDIFNA